MKKTAALLATLFLAGTALAQAKSYREIQSPPLRKFSMPQPKRIQLSNGMVIFLQEDHELPLIRGGATIRGGARNVPAAKAGLTGIYGQAWRTGGTPNQTGDQLDLFLESRAASVETGVGNETASASLNVLKGDFDAVFPIWLDLLRYPEFRQDKIDLAKTQANTSISRRNDEPGGILGRESTKLGYGPDSPYARQSEYATITAITRQDLLDFHKQTLHPNNIILAFIGDFDSAKMEKKLKDTFSSWKRGPQVAKPEPSIQAAKPGLYFAPKDDVTQASIAMVHGGTERSNPDYHALQVMNEVFSGGFSGRLMKSLRSQRGLTYGVGGSVGTPWDYPGLFRVQMSTKSETALESVEALRGEVRRLVTDPVTDEELGLAKESLLNAFVFSMDTREKALQQQVLLELYKYPADTFTKYPAEIGKVTAADVQRVAKKYVQPDQLAVLVVGKEAGFEKPLSSLGPVTTIDISIPTGSPNDKKAAPAAGNAEGLALARKVAGFVGNVAPVQTIRRTSSMSMKTPQGDMQGDMNSLTRYPDSQRTVITMAMGEITRVVSPDAAFMITPMGTQDLPGSQKDSSLSDIRSELVSVLKNIDNPKYTFTAGAKEGDAQVLEINAGGSNVKWHVDPATGRVLRSVTQATVPTPAEVVTEYSEWKAFGTLNLPALTTITRNGEKSAEARLTAVEVNPAVGEKDFVKP